MTRFKRLPTQQSLIRKARQKLLLAILLIPACISIASEEIEVNDMQQARRLHASGAILSLEHFVNEARAMRLGRVIDARLLYENTHGHHVYEILILDDGGEIWELEFDARNGALIEHEPGTE